MCSGVLRGRTLADLRGGLGVLLVLPHAAVKPGLDTPCSRLLISLTRWGQGASLSSEELMSRDKEAR